MVTCDYEGRELRVACRVLRPADVDATPARGRSTARPPEPEPPGLEALAAPGLAAVPVPAALPVSRLSYSGLAAYRRCGYRFYLDRALRLPPPDDGPARAARAGHGQDALPAVVRGVVVHQLPRGAGLRGPRGPSDERVAEAIEATGEPVRPDEVADVRGLVAGFVASPLAARIGAAERVHAELPFAFTLDTGGGRSLLIDGIVDVHARTRDGQGRQGTSEPGGALVVDYKSDRLEGGEPADRVEGAYAIQQLVYALAALRSGAARAEVVYCFLERPDEPVARTYTGADMPALEAELRELAGGVSEGRFEPTAEPHRGLCADCPGRPALCSWDEERTLAEPAAASGSGPVV